MSFSCCIARASKLMPHSPDRHHHGDSIPSRSLWQTRVQMSRLPIDDRSQRFLFTGERVRDADASASIGARAAVARKCSEWPSCQAARRGGESETPFSGPRCRLSRPWRPARGQPWASKQRRESNKVLQPSACLLPHLAGLRASARLCTSLSARLVAPDAQHLRLEHQALSPASFSSL